MQSLNNTQVSFSSSSFTCIHHEFVYQVIKHPQKLAVELDEQSLTYCELLYYVQVLSLILLNEYHVVPGDIVCQCVERSLSMVIGIMAIEMSGGVYCPLSARDPQNRLHALIQQTQSRLVLVHHLTKNKFNHDIVSLIIDSVLFEKDILDIVDSDQQLSNITVASISMAYTIFTSGSTGTPKTVQVSHQNFIHLVFSLVSSNILNQNDIIMQIARCSFDLHIQDVVGTLTTGATLVMLHPQGISDLTYLTDIIKKKSVTCFTCVPTILLHLFSFFQQSKNVTAVKSLRTICSGGEVCPVSLVSLIFSSVPHCSRLWNLYGPAEVTIVSTLHAINIKPELRRIPIGTPLSKYRCTLLNEYSQQPIIGQEGELYIGGAGVFAGYLGRDDLTAKALLEIDSQLFYRTGDLVTLDDNGLIHYQGRKDHQIKLH
ncbi:unnamed protein product, partial [Adineta steineri]